MNKIDLIKLTEKKHLAKFRKIQKNMLQNAKDIKESLKDIANNFIWPPIEFAVGIDKMLNGGSSQPCHLTSNIVNRYLWRDLSKKLENGYTLMGSCTEYNKLSKNLVWFLENFNVSVQRYGKTSKVNALLEWWSYEISIIIEVGKNEQYWEQNWNKYSIGTNDNLLFLPKGNLFRGFLHFDYNISAELTPEDYIKNYRKAIAKMNSIQNDSHYQKLMQMNLWKQSKHHKTKLKIIEQKNDQRYPNPIYGFFKK